ncbi:TIGR02281 family clan AA aspartic protease [Phenylobacterium kunshanense]|uniref:TIGR02281 family clan AA aspartic protease n=1 Tax=Phenylobacterium kunshanense TaxID=1445034 RepID=A0A328BI35_9CAUL|nr:TIGR02281 family clan AA aspartic protease [Phenylobacterium kunshanense]RAK66617.1 TIGR02281 family clan AA aspartic protease [Phenylobacterium kunshanense]
MSSLGRLAVVAGASAIVSAALVATLTPEPLRMARFGVDGFAAGSPKPGSGAVAKGPDGHFWADAEVNGRPVRFLVDTGATAVALTPRDAERLGIDVAALKPGYNVTTVGGSARASAVTLASVSVNGAKLENVQALVVSEGLDVSLLGMSYLGRLTRFEATRDTLRFEP